MGLPLASGRRKSPPPFGASPLSPEATSNDHQSYNFQSFSTFPCLLFRQQHVRIPFQGKETADHRYQGWATGLGISYGYSWILGKRWNIEATIGFGYAYSNYDKYDCATCGRFKGSQDKHYFGPTKAGISLIYIIK